MSDKLSQDKINEFKEAFDIFDINKDGCISHKELGMIMRAIGQNPTDNELMSMVQEVNSDVNKIDIDFQGFVALMAKRMKDIDTEEEVIEAFRIFDKDGIGLIPVEELVRALAANGEKISLSEIQAIVEEADTDNDGYINYQEFVRSVLNK